MSSSFLAFRRDLPGGRFVMITIEALADGDVVGRLRVERRGDPARQREGEPPVITEVHGHSQADVLRQLRQEAESDDRLAALLERWAGRERL